MALPKVDIHFIGRTSKDVPTLRTSPNGNKVTTIRVAVTPKRLAKSPTPGVEKQYIDETTQWYDVEIWNHEAEGVVETIQKAGGESIELEVSGELTHRKWQGKDGTERISYEVRRASVSIPFTGSQSITAVKKPYQGNGNYQNQQAASAPQQGYNQQAPQAQGYQQAQHPAQNTNYDWGAPAPQQGYDNSQWGAPASEDEAPF